MNTAARAAIGAATVMALAVGCASGIAHTGSGQHAPTTRPGNFHVHGWVLLAKRDEATWGRKHPLCTARGNNPLDPRTDGPHTVFDDVKAGARVTVTAASDTALRVGRLTTGHPSIGQGCAFGFDMVVPSTSRSYLIAVAGHPALQFSNTQMRRGPTVVLD